MVIPILDISRVRDGDNSASSHRLPLQLEGLATVVRKPINLIQD